MESDLQEIHTFRQSASGQVQHEVTASCSLHQVVCSQHRLHNVNYNYTSSLICLHCELLLFAPFIRAAGDCWSLQSHDAQIWYNSIIIALSLDHYLCSL